MNMWCENRHNGVWGIVDGASQNKVATFLVFSAVLQLEGVRVVDGNKNSLLLSRGACCKNIGNVFVSTNRWLRCLELGFLYAWDVKVVLSSQFRWVVKAMVMLLYVLSDKAVILWCDYGVI